MSVTIIAALFTVFIIAFFALMDHLTDKRNAEAEFKHIEIPAYKRKLNAEQLAKLEAELEGYKPTVQEYWLPTFKF